MMKVACRLVVDSETLNSFHCGTETTCFLDTSLEATPFCRDFAGTLVATSEDVLRETRVVTDLLRQLERCMDVMRQRKDEQTSRRHEGAASSVNVAADKRTCCRLTEAKNLG